MPPPVNESGIVSATVATANPPHQVSPYLPESPMLRRMVLISAAFTSFSFLGPYIVGIEHGENSWRITRIFLNGATILGQEFIYVMSGFGVLLFASALGWGRGMRYAGWLKLFIALSIPVVTTLGLAGLFDIALMTSGSGGSSIYVNWTYPLAYPAAMVAFVLNLFHGTRRA